MRVPRNVVIPGSTVKGYFQFIRERHDIYRRRFEQNMPFPWTDDPVLKTYKFTNIFRELDTGTIWYRKNIRQPYADHMELFFNTCVYRMFNFYPTMEYIMKKYHGLIEDYDPVYLEKILRGMKANGMKIFTSAHMITGTLGGDKIEQVCYKVFQPLWEKKGCYCPMVGDTLQSAFTRLSKKTPGFGPFIAYEVVTDLRHTRYLEHAPDIMTWANPGPGAQRGINRLSGLPVRPFHQQDTSFYVDYMRALLAISKKYLPKDFPALEMRDIEHSLCEFDKYERARLGHGKPRQRYSPPGQV